MGNFNNFKTITDVRGNKFSVYYLIPDPHINHNVAQVKFSIRKEQVLQKFIRKLSILMDFCIDNNINRFLANNFKKSYRMNMPQYK